MSDKALSDFPIINATELANKTEANIGLITKPGSGTAGFDDERIDIAELVIYLQNVLNIQNASTTVKGVVEEGTQDELENGDQTGGTGARLFFNAAALAAVFTKLSTFGLTLFVDQGNPNATDAQDYDDVVGLSFQKPFASIQGAVEAFATKVRPRATIIVAPGSGAYTGVDNQTTNLFNLVLNNVTVTTPLRVTGTLILKSNAEVLATITAYPSSVIVSDGTGVVGDVDVGSSQGTGYIYNLLSAGAGYLHISRIEKVRNLIGYNAYGVEKDIGHWQITPGPYTGLNESHRLTNVKRATASAVITVADGNAPTDFVAENVNFDLSIAATFFTGTHNGGKFYNCTFKAPTATALFDISFALGGVRYEFYNCYFQVAPGATFIFRASDTTVGATKELYVYNCYGNAPDFVDPTAAPNDTTFGNSFIEYTQDPNLEINVNSYS